MWLDRAASWLDRYYRWPVVALVVGIYLLVPKSKPVLGVLLLAAAAVMFSHFLRRLVRSFREGYRGVSR